MPRIPSVTKEQITPEDRPYYDEIVGSRGSVKGPYPVLLHSPKLAARVAATGAYVRFEADLPDGLREVVILATAAEVNAHYEFSAHASLARDAGVSEETIAAIAGGTAPPRVFLRRSSCWCATPTSCCANTRSAPPHSRP